MRAYAQADRSEHDPLRSVSHVIGQQRHHVRCSTAPVGQRMTINAGSNEPAHLEDHTVVREAVAVFHSAEDLQNAIDEVLRSGFHRPSLSLLANEAEVIAKLGHVYRKTSDLVADPAVPRTAYVSPEAIGDGQGAIIAAMWPRAF
jgi:hypothetical protein